MFLRSLDIENFICLKHFHIDFAPGVSVIIGRNGAGKTSLLKALLYAMNFIFTTDKTMGKDLLTAGNPDLKIKSIDLNEFYRHDQQSAPSTDANIHGVMDYHGKQLVWDIYKRSVAKASVYPSKYKDAYYQFMQIYRETNELPILAYYSDSFPHKQSSITNFAQAQIASGDKILRNFGYYQWDKENACTSIWENRLLSSLVTDLQLKGANRYIHGEVNFISSCIEKISHPLSEQCDDGFIVEKVFLSFNGNREPELWLRLKNGEEILFDNLPAGYMRLYSIALDLAYRAYLLNANVKGKVGNIEGLVMIDELDLHLHPTLALEVIERICHLFPNLQIIATTHSPLVLSNLKSNDGRNAVYKVLPGEDRPHDLPDLYGIDYNTTLVNALDTGKTKERVERIKDAILRAKRLGHDRVAEAKVQELHSYLSDDDYRRMLSDIDKAYALDKQE